MIVYAVREVIRYCCSDVLSLHIKEESARKKIDEMIVGTEFTWLESTELNHNFGENATVGVKFNPYHFLFIEKMEVIEE